MKRIYISLFILSSSVLFFAGCAKETTTKIETASNSSSQTTTAADEVTLSNEFDQAADEAVAVICNHKTTIWDGDIDTSQITLGVITIYYPSGNNIEHNGTKSRQGSDSIHLPMIGNKIVPWGTPGTKATMTLGCENAPGYEVAFINNKTSVRLNGTATLTYVSGPYIQNITTGDSLIEVIKSSNVEYTFDDNIATITYNPINLYQLRYFTSSGSTLYATTQGDTNINGFNSVSTWGINRYEKQFYTSILSNEVQNITDYTLSYNPLSGEKNIQDIAEPILCTYGVNSGGSPVSSGVPYGFNITWVNNGGQAQAVVKYYY